VTEVVAWAASNGDRSDNADYRYGKRRLRQIDGRIRFLTKRIEAAEVVDRKLRERGGGDEGILRSDRALCQCRGSIASGEHRGHRRGRSQPQPHQLGVTLGRALMKSAAGDSVVLQLPGGTEYLPVLEVCYQRISVEPFVNQMSEASAKGLLAHANRWPSPDQSRA